MASPRELSEPPRGAATPPAAGACHKPTAVVPNAIVRPSSDQAPPRGPLGTSHTSTGGPPDTSDRSSFDPTKKPTDWLLGDQKGKLAPSVPGSSRAVVPSSGLIQSPVLPDCSAT